VWDMGIIASLEYQNHWHCPSPGAHTILCPHFDLFHLDFQSLPSNSIHRFPFVFLLFWYILQVIICILAVYYLSIALVWEAHPYFFVCAICIYHPPSVTFKFSSTAPSVTLPFLLMYSSILSCFLHSFVL
jgi:hypothetical protein